VAKVGQTIRLNGPAASFPDCGLQPGELLAGRFRLGAVVGHGGQAVVFAASDLGRSGLMVAVKAARRDLDAGGRAEAEAVLHWEGGLLRRMRHPALPQLYRLERGPRLHWLARELIPGESLLALVRRQGPQAPHRVQAWAVQLCDLLSYLHSGAVPTVVGDLKPANLVLRPDQRLALVDLGAAHTLTRRPPRTPRPRHGTPGYAPPEQLAGRGYDERADVFALAVTCYELLTGLDATTAPLQFDLDRLDQLAPQLAPALRWALTLDLAARCPTAATLRAGLGAPAPAAPMLLGGGIALNQQRDIGSALSYRPRLLEAAVANGALDRWLALSPDPTLGTLRYQLRAALRAAPARRPPLEALLVALAPSEGSAQLQFDPPQLNLGEVPLRRWRVWSRPHALLLHNPTATPLRWKLSTPARAGADLRLLIDGKPRRETSGVLAPGARLRLDLVAMAASGPQHGELQLACGRHRWAIPWEATGCPGLPVGGRHVARLEELDFTRTDLVPAIEQLLNQGALVRWLRGTSQQAIAAEIEAALARRPTPLERRLLVGRLLNLFDAGRFPYLQLRGLEATTGRTLIADEPSFILFTITNQGTQPCALLWRSQTSWAQVAAAPAALAPGASAHISVRLHPPQSMQGPQQVALALEAGALSLNLSLPVQVSAQNWWQRLRRLFGLGGHEP
jgi:serine/threonine protein kinase